MAVYAIGDVQGCHAPLMRLLEQVRFDPADDRLWFAGDLVNRGSQSLEVLRFVKSLGKRATVVLGNHDLHLLAIAEGNRRHQTKDSSLNAVLKAPDRDELMHWLRSRSLAHYSARRGFLMVHAGVAPQWDLNTTLRLAGEVETVLRGPQFGAFMTNLYGNQPDCWSDDLVGWDRLRVIVNYFTRMRYCNDQGRMELSAKGPPGSQASGFRPWFMVPGRALFGQRLVFGHWSTLGYQTTNGVYCLDSGCVWGKRLTALKIRRDGSIRLYQVPCGARD